MLDKAHVFLGDVLGLDDDELGFIDLGGLLRSSAYGRLVDMDAPSPGFIRSGFEHGGSAYVCVDACRDNLDTATTEDVRFIETGLRRFFD